MPSIRTRATRLFACSAACRAVKSVYGVSKGGAYEPATKGWPEEQVWSTEKYLDFVPQLFDAVRNKFGFDTHMLHDVHHRLTPNRSCTLGQID